MQLRFGMCAINADAPSEVLLEALPFFGVISEYQFICPARRDVYGLIAEYLQGYSCHHTTVFQIFCGNVRLATWSPLFVFVGSSHFHLFMDVVFLRGEGGRESVWDRQRTH